MVMAGFLLEAAFYEMFFHSWAVTANRFLNNIFPKLKRLGYLAERMIFLEACLFFYNISVL